MSSLITLLITLAILGAADTSYIFINHMKKKPLVCPMKGGCISVTESKWAKTLGIRNDIVGFCYYILIIILSILIWSGQEQITLWMLLISSIAVLFSAFLVYIQAKVIKEYCFYCLVSALINLLIFIISILNFYLI